MSAPHLPRPAARGSAASPSATSATLAEAMSASAALSRLAERMRRSNACHAAALPLLPAALRSQLRAGPYDDDGWSILAGNAAVAAKLRHLVPRLEAGLRDAGLAVPAIRVKVVA